jgi:hypothetical protein
MLLLFKKEHPTTVQYGTNFHILYYLLIVILINSGPSYFAGLRGTGISGQQIVATYLGFPQSSCGRYW